jgi:hypothetical protein
MPARPVHKLPGELSPCKCFPFPEMVASTLSPSPFPHHRNKVIIVIVMRNIHPHHVFGLPSPYQRAPSAGLFSLRDFRLMLQDINAAGEGFTILNRQQINTVSQWWIPRFPTVYMCFYHCTSGYLCIQETDRDEAGLTIEASVPPATYRAPCRRMPKIPH